LQFKTTLKNNFIAGGFCMKIFKSVFTVVAVATCTFIASQAFALDPVYFKAPVDFGGTGCPQGTVRITGVNSDTLTVMFDQYDAAKPRGNAASKRMRASCSFAVPVRVPQGYQASLVTIDWQGYAEGNTELRRKYFFAGHPFVKPVVDSPKGDYLYRDAGIIRTLVPWSPCGQDVQLRLNSSIKAKSNKSYIAVDTVDLSNKILFQVQWRKCR
jgi:hypothetical protein